NTPKRIPATRARRIHTVIETFFFAGAALSMFSGLPSQAFLEGRQRTGDPEGESGAENVRSAGTQRGRRGGGTRPLAHRWGARGRGHGGKSRAPRNPREQ